MCKEMPVIPVNKVVDPKRIIGKKWRAKEEERHKGSLTQKKNSTSLAYYKAGIVVVNLKVVGLGHGVPYMYSQLFLTIVPGSNPTVASYNAGSIKL
jgi:hypothetical protein